MHALSMPRPRTPTADARPSRPCASPWTSVVPSVVSPTFAARAGMSGRPDKVGALEHDAGIGGSPGAPSSAHCSRCAVPRRWRGCCCGLCAGLPWALPYHSHAARGQSQSARAARITRLRSACAEHKPPPYRALQPEAAKHTPRGASPARRGEPIRYTQSPPPAAPAGPESCGGGVPPSLHVRGHQSAWRRRNAGMSSISSAAIVAGFRTQPIADGALALHGRRVQARVVVRRHRRVLHGAGCCGSSRPVATLSRLIAMARGAQRASPYGASPARWPPR